MCVSIGGFRRLRPLVRKTRTKVVILERHGLPFILHRYRNRKLFAAGAVAGAVLLYVMSLFIWNIHIEGNYSLSDPVVLGYLENIGIEYSGLYFDSALPGYPEMTLTSSELEQIEKLPVVVEIRENIDTYPPDYPDSHITLFPFSADFKWTRDNYGPLWIPAKGATVSLSLENLPLYRRIISVYEDNTLEVVDGQIIINGQPCSEYTFRQDYYFMMGDNRHHSSDSRYWGFVPEDHIVGTPVMIWLSLDKNKSFPFNIRWGRIFDLV